jgi:hypothetical protein
MIYVRENRAVVRVIEFRVVVGVAQMAMLAQEAMARVLSHRTDVESRATPRFLPVPPARTERKGRKPATAFVQVEGTYTLGA